MPQSILEEAELEATRSTHGPKCSWRVMLDGMTPKDRSDCEALVGGKIDGSIIGRVLRKRGYTNIADDTVLRHRRRNCASCRSLTK